MQIFYCVFAIAIPISSTITSPISMAAATQKLKYHISHFIALQPRHMKIGDIEKILAEEHGISRDTFYRDRNLTVRDSNSIPSERLDIYAALFGVTAEELKNYSVNVKPLSERKDLDKIKSITGLKTR